MGDHRATIKIIFEMHGKKYKMEDWYINWSPGSDGVDYRIIDWFRECWEDALGRYNKQLHDAYQKTHAAEIDQAEREELKRLKAKYEPGGSP